ncbi:Y-family DNA polymerase [Cyanobium sp. Morenito 9A2]|uniref:Y-family DNA polymerase n=1 Tax=Cyanobium sp. Morenito 9A2 TaxID=2823718 RepID=UPI0020CEC5CF|nr:Y-family DNA polymerase [Cyanobium sp. Morenito 9A2]MCP9850487.1 Y-family DNA polymerase [Cyanobium sp. Morenito 9A2]
MVRLRQAIALIDGNNFYAACEQALDPALLGRPLVVLSNNDGMVVSRSAEARRLGIAMGLPYFKLRPVLERHGVAVRSSNYALYGDMSQRLMTLLEAACEELEVYSIDEAFARLHRPAGGDLGPWARELRARIRQSLGLPIAIGLASTKVLAKAANRLAKGNPAQAGVLDLGRAPGSGELEDWLERVAIEDVWGIGRRLSRWCRLRGVANARQMRDMPSGELRARCGVVGVRLQLELRGMACLPLQQGVPAKQETCVSRSFSRPVGELEELRQAVASYVVRAAEKLRRQRQLAGALTVFARTSPFADGFYSQAASVRLPLASQDTAVLLAAALPLVGRLYRPHKRFQKAGVLLQELQGEELLQQHLLVPQSPEQQGRRAALMETVDRLNGRYGRGTVQWAACGLDPLWAMKRERLSGAATTRLEHVPVVWA